MTSVIDEQIKKLDSISPRLQKTLEFRSEESEVIEKDVDWTEELAMFRQMNINKPALAPLYDSVVNDAIIYRLKEEGLKSNVKELKVKLAENGYPEMIAATIIEDNYLYASEKQMFMHFDTENKLLNSYEIKSRTKVILMGEDKGEIHAKIKI